MSIGSGKPGAYNIGTILKYLFDNGYFDKGLNTSKARWNAVATHIGISETAICKVAQCKTGIGEEGYRSAVGEELDTPEDMPYHEGISRRIVHLITPGCGGLEPSNAALVALLNKLLALMQSEPADIEPVELIGEVKACLELAHPDADGDGKAKPQHGKKQIEDTLVRVLQDAIRFRRNNGMKSSSAGSAAKSAPAKDIDILERICGNIPSSSLLGVHEACSLESLYIPTRLCRPVNDGIRFAAPSESEEYSLLTVVDNDRSFILGPPGSGKTMALNAIGMSRCQQKDGKKHRSLILPEARIMSEYRVFVMNCGDFGNSYMTLEEYAMDCAKELVHRSRGEITLTAEQMTKNMLRHADDGLFLLVDGIESIRDAAERHNFLTVLREFVDTHSRTKMVLTATPDLWCGRESIVECCKRFDASAYLVQPFNESDIQEYCRKWSKLLGAGGSSDTVKIDLKDRDMRKLLGSPLLLSYFLATVAPEKNNVFTSELMLIGAMVDIATRNFLSTHKSSYKVSKYNIKAPIGALAVYMHQTNCMELPLTKADRLSGDVLSAEEVLESKGIIDSLDLYLSDRSDIRTKNAARFLAELKTYPFVQTVSKLIKDNGEAQPRSCFSFTSPIFQDYFAAYAIGKGCLCARVDEHGAVGECITNTSQFLAGWTERLCAVSVSGSDDTVSRFIKIVADAAGISRQGAYMFVDALAPMAFNLSVHKRKQREFAVRCLLSILAGGSSLTTERWILATDYALKNCLYHAQTHDIRRIIESASRRELVLSHIYNSFGQSIRDENPWPDFEWCMGYITYNWFDFAGFAARGDTERFGTPEFEPRFQSMIDEGLKRHTAVNRMEDLRAMLVKELDIDPEMATVNSDREITPYILVLVATFCSHVWILARHTPIAELGEAPGDSRSGGAGLIIDDDTIRVLFALIGHTEQRISNQACFSLMHCITMQRKGVSGMTDNPRILQEMTGFADDALYADYRGRRSEHHDQHAMCGGLRYFTHIDLEKGDYGNHVGDDKMEIRQYYRALWESYGGVDSEGKGHGNLITDDNRRQLMLIFKLCFFAAVWTEGEDRLDARSAVEPMKQLFGFRYPGYDPLRPGPLPGSGNSDDDSDDDSSQIRQIGLAYDREAEFFENLHEVLIEIIRDFDIGDK